MTEAALSAPALERLLAATSRRLRLRRALRWGSHAGLLTLAGWGGLVLVATPVALAAPALAAAVAAVSGLTVWGYLGGRLTRLELASFLDRQWQLDEALCTLVDTAADAPAGRLLWEQVSGKLAEPHPAVRWWPRGTAAVWALAALVLAMAVPVALRLADHARPHPLELEADRLDALLAELEDQPGADGGLLADRLAAAREVVARLRTQPEDPQAEEALRQLAADVAADLAAHRSDADTQRALARLEAALDAAGRRLEPDSAGDEPKLAERRSGPAETGETPIEPGGSAVPEHPIPAEALPVVKRYFTPET